MPFRIKVLLVVFLLTGLSAVMILWQSGRDNTFGNEISEVGVNDTTWIEKIEIKKPDGKQLILSQEDFKWKVNQKYPAREQLMTLFFFGISKLEVKRPVSENSKEKILSQIKSKGILITLTGENQQKSFYALTNESDPNSSYYLNADDDQPYIVEVPGVKGNITNLAGLGEGDWRSRDLFKSNYRSIQKVVLQYPEEAAQNFEIVFKDGLLRVKDLENQDSMKVRQYIYMIENFTADRFVVEGKDSLMKVLKSEKPGVILEITDISANRSEKLSIYASKMLKGRVYGVLQAENELITLNPNIVKYLLVNKNFFVKKEDKSEEQ